MVAETIETGQPQVITEALLIVDEGLSRLQSRELVSAGEVADLLLDLRTTLTRSGAGLGELDDDKFPVASN